VDVATGIVLYNRAAFNRRRLSTSQLISILIAAELNRWGSAKDQNSSVGQVLSFSLTCQIKSTRPPQQDCLGFHVVAKVILFRDNVF